MDNRVLQIVLQAKDEASAKLKKFGDVAEKTGSTIKEKLEKGTVGFGVAFAATTGIIVSSIAAYSEAENNAAQLEAVLKSTGHASGLMKEDILDQAAALQQLTTFSDDAITSTANLLLTFTNIKGPVMQQAIQMTTDMSTALGQDLKASAIQLGKALNDPVKGITALSRVGVSFTEEQKTQIQTLVASGKTMDAQQVILAELGKEFGGSAYAKSQTFSGQMEILKNNIGDLQETIGKGLLDALKMLPGGFEGVNKKILALNKYLSEHKDVLLGVTAVLLTLAVTFGVLLVAALVVAAGTAGLVIGAMGLLVAAIAFGAIMVVSHWSKISAFFGQLWIDIKTTFNNFVTGFTTGVSNLVNNTVTWFQQLPGKVNSFFYDLFYIKIPFAIGFALGWLSTAIPNMVNSIGNWFANLPGVVSNHFNNAKNSIVNSITGAVSWLGGELSALPGRISAWINAIPGIVTGVFTKTKDGVTGKMNELLSAITGIWDRIRGIFDNIGRAVQGAIDAVNRGFSAGAKVGVRAYAEGGWVDKTGPAIVHQGEYVLSRDMLAGRKSIEAPIGGGGTTVTLGPVYVQDMNDVDSMLRRVSLAYKFDSSI